MDHVRDSAMAALILGFFASAWFGWAQERPPRTWRIPLISGAVLSLAVAATGGVLAWSNWSGASALDQPGAMRTYAAIVGVEFAIAAAGAVVLARRGRPEYTALWICLVVGLHFWPMAPVLEDPALYALGALMTAVAVVAVLASRRTMLAPSAVTGAGAGACLLAFATRGALAAVT